MRMHLIRSSVLSIAVLALGAGTLEAQAEAAGCGTEPKLARATVLGSLHGATANAGSGSPWEPFLAVKPDSVQPFEDAAACEGVLMALAEAGGQAATDSLPLQGIVNLGDLGVVVVRARGAPAARGSARSMTLLAIDFKVLRYDRFQF